MTLCETLPADTNQPNTITRCWQSLGGLEKQMLNFLENRWTAYCIRLFARDPRKGHSGFSGFFLYEHQSIHDLFRAGGWKGMDTEGFSGRDGQTSIFDYWSMDCIRKWRNGEQVWWQKITPEQQHLLDFIVYSSHFLPEKRLVVDSSSIWCTQTKMAGSSTRHKQYTFCENTKRTASHCLSTLIVWLLKLPSIYPHAFDYLQMLPQTEDIWSNRFVDEQKKSFLCSPTKLPRQTSARSQNFEDHFLDTRFPTQKYRSE